MSNQKPELIILIKKGVVHAIRMNEAAWDLLAKSVEIVISDLDVHPEDEGAAERWYPHELEV